MHIPCSLFFCMMLILSLSPCAAAEEVSDILQIPPYFCSDCQVGPPLVFVEDGENNPDQPLTVKLQFEGNILPEVTSKTLYLTEPPDNTVISDILIFDVTHPTLVTPNPVTTFAITLN